MDSKNGLGLMKRTLAILDWFCLCLLWTASGVLATIMQIHGHLPNFKRCGFSSKTSDLRTRWRQNEAEAHGQAGRGLLSSPEVPLTGGSSSPAVPTPSTSGARQRRRPGPSPDTSPLSLPPPPFARRAQPSRGAAPAPAGPRRPQLALRRARPSGPTAAPSPSRRESTASGEKGARGTRRDWRPAPADSRGRPGPRRGEGRGGRRGRAPTTQEGGSRRSEAAPRGRGGGGPRCHGSAAPAEGLSGRRRAAGRAPPGGEGVKAGRTDGRAGGRVRRRGGRRRGQPAGGCGDALRPRAVLRARREAAGVKPLLPRRAEWRLLAPQRTCFMRRRRRWAATTSSLCRRCWRMRWVRQVRGRSRRRRPCAHLCWGGLRGGPRPPPPPAASPSFRPRCEGSPPAAPGPGHDWSPGAHPPHRERPGRVDVAVRFPCVRRGFPAFSCAVIPATKLGLVHPRAPSLHNSKVMVLERVLTPVVAVG